MTPEEFEITVEKKEKNMWQENYKRYSIYKRGHKSLDLISTYYVNSPKMAVMLFTNEIWYDSKLYKDIYVISIDELQEKYFQIDINTETSEHFLIYYKSGYSSFDFIANVMAETKRDAYLAFARDNYYKRKQQRIYVFSKEELTRSFEINKDVRGKQYLIRRSLLNPFNIKHIRTYKAMTKAEAYETYQKSNLKIPTKKENIIILTENVFVNSCHST